MISDKVALPVLMLSILVAIGATAYQFAYQKDYEFRIEASCDSTTEECFHRSCEEDECPPNELENYKVFKIEAYDFTKCTDNSCSAECAAGIIRCEEVQCGESDEDECVSPESQAESNPA